MNKKSRVYFGFALLISFFTGFVLRNILNTNSHTPASQLIELKHAGIHFSLPEGYAAYVQEGFEGGYAANIYVGKKISPIQFSDSSLHMYIQKKNGLVDSEKWLIDNSVFMKNVDGYGTHDSISFNGGEGYLFSNMIDAGEGIGFVGSIDNTYEIEMLGMGYGGSPDPDLSLYRYVINSFGKIESNK